MKKYKQYFIIVAFVIMGCKNELVEEKEPLQDIRNFCSYTVNGIEKRLYNKDSTSIYGNSFINNGQYQIEKCPNIRLYNLTIYNQNFRNAKAKIDYIESFNLYYFTEESAVRNIRKKGDCNLYKTFDSSILHFEYPDVIYQPFEVDTLSMNSMKVIKIDTVSKYIEGEFNLTFNKTKEAQKDKYFNVFPNRYEFRNGRFSVYYK
jgi:hypothetical protein